MKVENFKGFILKMLRCEARAFLLVRLYDKSAFFYSAENSMRMNLDHLHKAVGSGPVWAGQTFGAW